MLLRTQDGDIRPLDVDRWSAGATLQEQQLMDRCAPPVLDVGCGPGRHVHALASRGVPALGVDIAPSAVALARSKGVAVLERSVFSSLPGAGRWGSALLLDGNIGIGGDPTRLLRRIHALLRTGGRALVELQSRGSGVRHVRMRIEHSEGSSAWFPWAEVGVDAIDYLAASAGFRSTSSLQLGGRWFSWLLA